MNRVRWSFLYLITTLLVLHSAGCASRRTPEITPLSAREREIFFARAQDERRFWITKYDSEQGPIFSGAHRVHTDKFAFVPFEARRNLPVPIISVRLRTPNEYDALIDTSSRSSWMEFELANQQGVIPLGPPATRLIAEHVNDLLPGYLCVASRIKIDQLFVETALFYVKAAQGPLIQLTRNDRQMRAPIVFGAEFIRAFHFLQIDYPNRTVIFSTTTPYSPNPDRLIASVPMRDLNGHIVVEGLFDEMETPFLLDSLGDFSVASNLSTDPAVRQITLGDLVLRNTPHVDIFTTELGLHAIPRIGRDVLSRFVVTFDARNRFVHFERP